MNLLAHLYNVCTALITSVLGNTSIKLKINEKKLMNNLEFAFTNEATVLSELMQNARRAGATKVDFIYDEYTEELVVEDDGHGIDDMQSLLHAAESNWDDEIMDTESPYGLGFLSAIFSADRIKIESNKQGVEFTKEKILNFDKVKLKKSDRSSGTIITLYGFELHRIDLELKGFARGFPIDVTLNGQLLKRDHAINSDMEFIDTEIGACYLSGYEVELITNERPCGTKDKVVYLQGIEVYNSCHFSRKGIKNIIHLDPEQFKGRLPDRDILVNQVTALESVDETIKKLWQEKLELEVWEEDSRCIADKYYSALKFWWKLDLLNDNPYLPKEVLQSWDVYPVLFQEWEEEGTKVNKLIPRDEVAAGKYILTSFDYDYDSFQAWMYAYVKGTYGIQNALDNGHWVYDYVIDLDVENISLELTGGINDDIFDGEWTYRSPVIFCESAILNGPLGEAVIEDEAFIYANGFVKQQGYPCMVHNEISYIISPSGESRGDVVRQITNFSDEHDIVDEQAMSREETLFENFLLSKQPGKEVALLNRILHEQSLESYDSLVGKVFSISVSGKNADRAINIEVIDKASA